mmetsp:Transcript_13800/g.58420  ORF Transcript_13800/g.58420 Transcript_13800/m.58420 type:complete len:320 (+) Transcript_13800:539-1498(+)
MVHYGLTGIARGDARLRQRHGPIERLAERGCHRGSLRVGWPRRGRKQLRRVGPLHTGRRLEDRLGLRLRLVQVHHHPRELHQHGPGQLRVLHQRRRCGRELVESTLELADVLSHVEEVLILHDAAAGRALRCGCAGSEENIARGAGLRRRRCGLRRRRRRRRSRGGGERLGRRRRASRGRRHAADALRGGTHQVRGRSRVIESHGVVEPVAHSPHGVRSDAPLVPRHPLRPARLVLLLEEDLQVLGLAHDRVGGDPGDEDGQMPSPGLDRRARRVVVRHQRLLRQGRHDDAVRGCTELLPQPLEVAIPARHAPIDVCVP